MANQKLEKSIELMARKANLASRGMALLSEDVKNAALRKMAKVLVSKKDYLIRENKKDLKFAEGKNYSKALIDRLTINEGRVKSMADCLLDTVKIKDPVGEVMKVFKRPNGLIIKKVRVPIGVIGIVYESRPNVTSDCIGLCLKSGNAVILKGGKEAYFTNKAIFKVIKESLKGSKIPLDAFAQVDSTDRKAMHVVLKQDKYVDLIIPRGGEGLIRFIAQNSLIPVIKHYKGVCHTYVSDKADFDMARQVCFNAKVNRPGVCNAMETMLVHKNAAKKFLPLIISDLQNAGVEIRGCEKTRKIVTKGIKKATLADWFEEYLDLVLSVKVVEDTKEAIDHINTFGSKHSDSIITKSKMEAEDFLKSVDSATVYANASTRFTDGYEFGFGAEVGISTDKLHARGPMALEELTTYKYLIYGTGQIRK